MCTRVIEPLGRAVMNEKKVSQPAWVRCRINGRTVFDPFRLPPNGARLNGLPASWTSSRDTDHRGAFRSWWPGSPALVIVSTHGWLIHFSPPSLPLFLPFLSVPSSFASRAIREERIFDSMRARNFRGGGNFCKTFLYVWIFYSSFIFQLIHVCREIEL